MSEHTHTYTHQHGHSHDGDEHSHEHTHTYVHDHADGDKEHTHDDFDHDREEAHEHDHHHHHETCGNMDQVMALLDYTCKHNHSHADELPKLAEKIKSLGHEDAATKVLEAAGFFDKGNDLLQEALDSLKKD